ncbi:MAG TPA: hypothetical protein VFQ28_02000, partial [Gaiella sp.]|nr:hypothetical protein [Gaiella sp.]
MTSITHEDRTTTKDGWSARILVREMWASIAIVAMWAAVAVSATWGADFVSTSGSGATSTTVPAGVAVALFASIGTWAVAKHGLGR